jgi:predicted nucleotidyltransferase
MRDSVDRVVRPFLDATDRALGTGYSAVLYGSGARGDFVPGRSDINLVLVIEDLSPPVLRSLGPAFTGWRSSKLEPPLLLSRTEWSRASDAFPIEITDMRTSYQVLRGADPLSGMQVDRSDLRRALERELRGKLLRLRQAYVASAGDSDALGAVAGESAATIMVLLRALLSLLGRHVPTNPLELAAEAAAVLGIEGEHLLQVVRHRSEPRWRCPPEDFERYLEAVERAARFVDQLQLGDL